MAWLHRDKSAERPAQSPDETWAGRAMRRMLKDCATCSWFLEGPGTSMKDSYWICGYDNRAFSKGKFASECEHYEQRPIKVTETGEIKLEG